MDVQNEDQTYYLICSHVIIVEVDENKHARYDSTCETKRECEIYAALKQPVVFIRFNPDSYINKYGEKIPSCWKPSKNGMTITDTHKWDKRLTRLGKEIDYWMTNVPDSDMTFGYLYYDAIDLEN